MKGVVARFRHGPKTAEKGDLRVGISKTGKIVLEDQGKTFAEWMLAQKGDRPILKKRGVKLNLAHSGIARALTSAVHFTRGFKATMLEAGVAVHATEPVAQKALAPARNWDYAAMSELIKARGGEMAALKAYHADPSKVSSETPTSQGSRIEAWASEQTEKVQETTTGPVPVIVGFTHDPPIGSARAIAHPKRSGERYLVRPGPKAITTPGGLITHVSDSGIVTLHEMTHSKKGHRINYVGHMN